MSLLQIRLAAKEVIKICVDDLEFKVEEFVPVSYEVLLHVLHEDHCVCCLFILCSFWQIA